MPNDDQWKAICDNTPPPRDDTAPRRSRLDAGGVVTLALAALFVMLLFLAPQAAWTVPLAAALIMMDVTIGRAVRQWARGRTSKYFPNAGTSARRRRAGLRSRPALGRRSTTSSSRSSGSGPATTAAAGRFVRRGSGSGAR